MPGMGNGERDNALKQGGLADPTWVKDHQKLGILEPTPQLGATGPTDIREEDACVAPYKLQRHPNSARFHELLELAGDLHDRKQSDYGRDKDPFANVRASEEWGIDGWVGAMVRLNDKVRRLQAFAQKGSLANEGVLDSFMDIAVYALIAHVLYEEASS